MKYYDHMGQQDLWFKEAIEATRLDGHLQRADLMQQIYRQGGQRALITAVVKPKKAWSKGFPDSPCEHAVAYQWLGQKNLALDNLERCYATGKNGMLYLKTDPFWASLQDQPRYHDLLRRLGLE
jgi:hypothetical protein